jgi:hypothetical protein
MNSEKYIGLDVHQATISALAAGPSNFISNWTCCSTCGSKRATSYWRRAASIFFPVGRQLVRYGSIMQRRPSYLDIFSTVHGEELTSGKPAPH